MPSQKLSSAALVISSDIRWESVLITVDLPRLSLGITFWICLFYTFAGGGRKGNYAEAVLFSETTKKHNWNKKLL